MIALRAVLLCESIRIEVDGTLTLVGVCNERIVAPHDDGPIDGPIALRSLTVLVVVSGLRGLSSVSIRHAIRATEDPESRQDLALHEHDPGTDEHNFIFPRPNLAFARPGAYTLDVHVAVTGNVLRASHPFLIERAPQRS